ncbi:30S ribosomal protein S2 [Candidatus Undinarchaeota archaeon]
MSENDLLISLDKYLAAGVHIGTQQREAGMKSFIYSIRPDGLSVFNIQQINDRIRQLASLLSKYDAPQILVVVSRENGKDAVLKFGEMTGTNVLPGRFMPGTLTNPNYEEYTEPDLVLIGDPNLEQRVIKEASKVGIPVVSFCDTNNTTNNIDFIVPGNNKGRKSIALMFWLLSKEMLKIQGKISTDSDMKYSLEDFQE